MRLARHAIVFVFLCSAVFAQPTAKPAAFDVASVRPSGQTVGPDYNNQITITQTGFIAKNATLRRLIAEAWNLQLNQVVGPGWISGWIDRDEYDISARFADGTPKEQIPLMLRSFLAERFKLKEHTETRAMHVCELTLGKNGTKLRPVADGEPVQSTPGFHFHGNMRQFVDLLAVQISIPSSDDPSVPSRAGGPPILVLDKTGLQGTFDFGVDVRPELNTDMFTVWQRALDEQLGLKIEKRQGEAPVIVVDDAAKIPTEN